MILLGKVATAALRAVAVLRRFTDDQAQAQLVMQAGDRVQVDATTYAVTHVGVLANTSLQTIGHVSLIFAPVPGQPMENALYLDSAVKPQLQVGSTITYITA